MLRQTGLAQFLVEVTAPFSVPLEACFDFKCDCTPPTIFLGLLLCPWTWGIFFGGIQQPPIWVVQQ